jgi:hypothetical protein
MKVTVTKQFPGCLDGERETRIIKVGEVITGDLARVALDAGWAEAEKKPKTNPARPASGKQNKPPQNKAHKKASLWGEVKGLVKKKKQSGAASPPDRV